MGGPIIKHRRERDDDELPYLAAITLPGSYTPVPPPVKPTWTCEEHGRERVGEDELEYHRADAPGAER